MAMMQGGGHVGVADGSLAIGHVGIADGSVHIVPYRCRRRHACRAYIGIADNMPVVPPRRCRRQHAYRGSHRRCNSKNETMVWKQR